MTPTERTSSSILLVGKTTAYAHRISAPVAWNSHHCAFNGHGAVDLLLVHAARFTVDIKCLCSVKPCCPKPPERVASAAKIRAAEFRTRGVHYVECAGFFVRGPSLQNASTPGY